MLFTNHRSQNSFIGNRIQQSNTVNNGVNMFSIIKPSSRNISVIANQMIVNEVEPIKTPKKMKWGNQRGICYIV